MVEKRKRDGFGFGINDCPLWLFKVFDGEAKSQYNNQYWVVLLNWYRKSQAYDVFIREQGVENVESLKEVRVMGKGEKE